MYNNVLIWTHAPHESTYLLDMSVYTYNRIREGGRACALVPFTWTEWMNQGEPEKNIMTVREYILSRIKPDISSYLWILRETMESKRNLYLKPSSDENYKKKQKVALFVPSSRLQLQYFSSEVDSDAEWFPSLLYYEHLQRTICVGVSWKTQCRDKSKVVCSFRHHSPRCRLSCYNFALPCIVHMDPGKGTDARLYQYTQQKMRRSYVVETGCGCIQPCQMSQRN